jgi:putative ABC transport system permease protein
VLELRLLAPWELLYIYRARLRARLVLVQELLAVLGLAVGVALLFASQVASTSLNGSIRQLTSGVVGRASLQLVARAPDGFDERLLGRVRRLPGVQGAEPVLEQRATVLGPLGQRSVDLLAGEPRYLLADLRSVGGSLPRDFTAAQLASVHALALPAPVAEAIGVDSLQTLTLEVGATRLTALMGAKLDAGSLGALVDSPLAIAPLAYAQAVTGLRGRLTRILVRTLPGRLREVRRELGALAAGRPVNVEPADYDSRLFDTAAAPADASTSLFSAISALVGFLFAFNAILMTLPLRRSLIEALRHRGATRAMTVQVLLFDALVLGVLGSLLGLGLGEALSIAVFRANPGYLSFAFPVGSQRIVTWQSVVLSVAAGLLAAGFGVLVPLRGALAGPLRADGGRVRRHPGARTLSLAAGVACLAGTTFVLLARPQAAVLGSLALAAALLLLLPSAFDVGLAAFERLQRPLYAASTRLALVELRTPATRVRSLAIAATAAIAVFGSVAIQGAQGNLQDGLDRTAAQVNRVAALWVAAAGPGNTLATTPFPSAGAGTLARLSGIDAVGVYRGGFLDMGSRRVWVLAPPSTSPRPIPPSQLLAGEEAVADARLHGHGWAVLSRAIAAELHLRLGEPFTLPAPRPTVFRVAALSTNLGWPPGAVIVNAADYARAWDSDQASAYLVTLVPGVSPARASREIRRALGPSSGLAVQTAAQRTRQWETTGSQGLSRLTQIAALVLIAAILATAGALSSMIWQRRPQLAYIKRQGYKRGVLWRALLCESALLLGSGCSLGALFGLYGQLLLSHALASVTGFPVVVSLAGAAALFSFALVCTVALAILALPGYLAVRVRPTTVSTT